MTDRLDPNFWIVWIQINTGPAIPRTSDTKTDGGGGLTITNLRAEIRAHEGAFGGGAMNSLFFDYPCKGDGRDERGAVSTDLAWCKSENILACALDSGRVAVYQDEVMSILAIERHWSYS